MSQLFLVSLEKTYTTEPIYFYFVNRPIRHGNAWVFPVGINDALWLSSQKITLELVFQIILVMH